MKGGDVMSEFNLTLIVILLMLFIIKDSTHPKR